MGTLQFKKLKDEQTDLITLYTTNVWPYHSNPTPSEGEIAKKYQSGWFADDRESFWIEEDGEKVGLIVVSDISDTIPILLDIKISESARGKGYGEQSINWIVDYLFSNYKDKIRFEAYTRADNYAMRKVFTKCLFQKEGYLRHAWENDDNSIHAAIIYGIIRKDWEQKSVTPIHIDDVPF